MYSARPVVDSRRPLPRPRSVEVRVRPEEPFLRSLDETFDAPRWYEFEEPDVKDARREEFTSSVPVSFSVGSFSVNRTVRSAWPTISVSSNGSSESVFTIYGALKHVNYDFPKPTHNSRGGLVVTVFPKINHLLIKDTDVLTFTMPNGDGFSCNGADYKRLEQNDVFAVVEIAYKHTVCGFSRVDGSRYTVRLESICANRKNRQPPVQTIHSAAMSIGTSYGAPSEFEDPRVADARKVLEKLDASEKDTVIAAFSKIGIDVSTRPSEIDKPPRHPAMWFGDGSLPASIERMFVAWRESLNAHESAVRFVRAVSDFLSLARTTPGVTNVKNEDAVAAYFGVSNNAPKVIEAAKERLVSLEEALTKEPLEDVMRGLMLMGSRNRSCYEERLNFFKDYKPTAYMCELGVDVRESTKTYMLAVLNLIESFSV